MTPPPTHVIYPELPDPLTPSDLQQLFNPSFDERNWAPTVTRTVESQVVASEVASHLLPSWTE